MTEIGRGIAMLPFLALAIACSESEDTVPDSLKGDDRADLPVVLEASIREWGDIEIVVDYTLRNDSDEAIVVFNESANAGEGGTRTLQSELNADGEVRLFTGKSELRGIAFVTPPEIPGLVLGPGDSIGRVGSRPLPITIDYDFDGALGPFMPEAIEFCVGHGRAEVVLPTRRESGEYPLNMALELQTLECVTLSR